ncbi:MAG: ion transporter [Acidobacteriota bacterium]
MIERARSIVERSDTPAGRRFDLFIQLLIVASVLAFSLATLPDLDDEVRVWLKAFDDVILVIFTVEYLLRLGLAEKKLKFVFSFFGLIDLIAILPFYLSTGMDLRSARACRLLRLFKLLRFSPALQRYHRALGLVKNELVIFVSTTLLLLYLSAVGIYYFESEAQPEAFGSVFHSLWWAVVTLTTVGYGDIVPVTPGGRVFTFIVTMIGLAIVAMPAGLLASALSEARRLEREEREQLEAGDASAQT